MYLIIGNIRLKHEFERTFEDPVDDSVDVLESELADLAAFLCGATSDEADERRGVEVLPLPVVLAGVVVALRCCNDDTDSVSSSDSASLEATYSRQRT